MATDTAHWFARILKTRWIVRAPVGLYRAHLGFLFGRRLMMLTHRGRTSGERRYVVVEVVDRPAPDVVVIASGFGASAQWYRNLRAEPRCGVSTGLRHQVPAVAELLSDDESAAALERYAAEHPKAWQQLRDAITVATGDPASKIPIVRIRLSR